MSRTIKTYLALDLDTKKGVWTGAELVYATVCDIYVSNYGSATATDLVLALHHGSIQIATCTFTDNSDGFFKGSLDLDTVALQAIMETMVEPADMKFVVTLHDTTNDSCLLDDYAQVMSDPYTGRQGVPVSASGVSVGGSISKALSGTTFDALTVVRSHSDFALYPQNSSDATLMSYTAGIALSASTVGGQSISFVTSGILTSTSWTWARGKVFYTSTGVLTQTVPTSGFVQCVGFAYSATSMTVKIEIPIGI